MKLTLQTRLVNALENLPKPLVALLSGTGWYRAQEGLMLDDFELLRLGIRLNGITVLILTR